MFTNHRTQGIILRQSSIREADQIFVIYTREFGKIEVCGRSIRKGGSKLKMNMSLFSLVEVEFIQGKSYNTLVDNTSLFVPRKAFQSLEKISLLYRISEVTLALIYGQEQDEKVFLFLKKTIEEIDKEDLSSKKDLQAFFCFFSFRLLHLLGYKIYTEKCVLCKSEIKKECYFDPQEGGVLCNKCFIKNPSGVYVKEIDNLRLFFNTGFDKKLTMSGSDCLKILTRYLSFLPETQNLKF